MEQNLYEAIKGRKSYIPEKKLKNYMYQLLKALDFMHRSGIFHRDIKPFDINNIGKTFY
jgi:renal tumor antigen